MEMELGLALPEPNPPAPLPAVQKPRHLELVTRRLPMMDWKIDPKTGGLVVDPTRPLPTGMNVTSSSSSYCASARFSPGQRWLVDDPHSIRSA